MYPSIVKDILTQVDCLGTRARWVSKIQEYDLDIRPTKLVKGQGLAKILTEGNEKALGMICQNDLELTSSELQILSQLEWYKDIIYYLQNLSCPSHLVDHKRRALRLRETKYFIVKDGLGWRNPEGVILRCVDEVESKKLLFEFHLGFCGGHYAANTTTHKIL